MKSSTLVILFLIFAGLAPAHAQGTGRLCAPTAAEKTSVAAIASEPEKWLGKCVTVSGIYSSEQIYADADAIYGVNRNVIGGFADGKGTIAGFWSGQFTGRVADCAAADKELALGLLRSPGISVNGRTMGCPESKGPFLLFMSQRDLKPAGLVRRLAPATGADLAPMPADWEQRDAITGLARQFETALQSSTSEMLAQEIGNSYRAEELMFGQETAISKLKKLANPTRQVFVHASSSPSHVSAEDCYCLTKDCRKLWPIARRDADNQAERPYACVRIDGYREGDLWRYTVDPSRDFDGLPEPR